VYEEKQIAVTPSRYPQKVHIAKNNALCYKLSRMAKKETIKSSKNSSKGIKNSKPAKKTVTPKKDDDILPIENIIEPSIDTKKVKLPIDIPPIDDAVIDTDVKVDDELPIAEEDLESDEAEIDEEELDPFKDKWEE
jgi:hypothetical protein